MWCIWVTEEPWGYWTVYAYNRSGYRYLALDVDMRLGYEALTKGVEVLLAHALRSG